MVAVREISPGGRRPEPKFQFCCFELGIFGKVA